MDYRCRGARAKRLKLLPSRSETQLIWLPTKNLFGTRQELSIEVVRPALFKFYTSNYSIYFVAIKVQMRVMISFYLEQQTINLSVGQIENWIK